MKFYAYGSGWTDLAFQRLDGAADEWYVYTKWKPTVVRWQSGDPTTKLIYRQSPPGPADCTINLERARTCVETFANSWLRISRVTIVFNKDMPFYYGTADTCQDNSCINFEGVATHEFGHAAGLIDLTDVSTPPCVYDSSLWTMCTGGENRLAIYKRTVETDDIAAAEALY